MIVNGTPLLIAAPIVDMVPAKCSIHGTSYGLGEAGYDIRIKQNVSFHWSPHDGQMSVCVDMETPRLFSSGRFALASAVEEFRMPTNLVGIVHDKSTWARRGLSVFNTVIEPGWKGFLTLELVYHGEDELVIPAGSGIAQVVFHKLVQEQAYTGKYQNQANKPVPARES